MAAGPRRVADRGLSGRRDVAATPGKGRLPQSLIELIQYAPATAEVRSEPVLIVPAWIMKYYILDLSPHNSLVKYLTGQGYTVFMISWKNPGPADRDLSMEDYRTLGVMAALDAVSAIVPARKSMRSATASAARCSRSSRQRWRATVDDRLKSATFFAAQTDFTEAGELMLFINESQLAFLEDVMWEQGFLDSRQMAGTFQMLRSNDLIWSRMVRTYLMGEREGHDRTSTPGTPTPRACRIVQHAEYLRRLFPRQRSRGGTISCRWSGR
jgi:polyhydroxyalkanoate synthase